MDGSDAWVLNAAGDTLTDYFLGGKFQGNGGVVSDTIQNLEQIETSEVDGKHVFSFWRDRDTGDTAQDNPLSCDGDAFFIYAYGAQAGAELSWHGASNRPNSMVDVPLSTITNIVISTDPPTAMPMTDCDMTTPMTHTGYLTDILCWELSSGGGVGIDGTDMTTHPQDQ